jgi:hypothetical protein
MVNNILPHINVHYKWRLTTRYKTADLERTKKRKGGLWKICLADNKTIRKGRRIKSSLSCSGKICMPEQKNFIF